MNQDQTPVRINPQGLAGRGYGLDFSDPNVDWSRAVPPPSGFLSAPPPPKPSLAELVNAHNPSWIFNYPLPEDHPNLIRRPPPPARRTKAPPQEAVRRPWEGDRGTSTSVAPSASNNTQPTPRGTLSSQPKPKVSGTSTRVRPTPASQEAQQPLRPRDESSPQPTRRPAGTPPTPPQTQAHPAQSTRSRLAELLEAQQLIEAQERSALELILAENNGASRSRPLAGPSGMEEATTHRPLPEPTAVSNEPSWLLHAHSESPRTVNRSGPSATDRDSSSSPQQSPASPRVHQDPVATRASPGRNLSAEVDVALASGRPPVGGGARLARDQPAGAVTRREANAMREIFGGAFPPQQQPRRAHPGSGPDHVSPGQRRGEAAGSNSQGEWELNDFSYEALLELGSMAVSTGLTRAQLAKYKPKPYQKPLGKKTQTATGTGTPSSRPSSRISRSNERKPSTPGASSGGGGGKSTDDDAECTVCLDVVEVGQDSLTLPCTHVFHHKCIIQWLSRTNRCPTCRYEIQRQKEK